MLLKISIGLKVSSVLLKISRNLSGIFEEFFMPVVSDITGVNDMTFVKGMMILSSHISSPT